MVVNYSETDIQGFDNFPYLWRFSGYPWGELSYDQESAIILLTEKRSNQICEMRQIFIKQGNCINEQKYNVIFKQSLEDKNKQEIIKWMDEFPIDMAEEVYINWRNGTSVVTSWKVFKELWDDFWYPFDMVDVFDDTLDWAVLFGTEEWAAYIRKIS